MDSARTSVRERGFALLVATSSESNDPSNLFIKEPFVSQFRNGQASQRRVQSLPRQGNELARILFVAEDQCDAEPVVDVLPSHSSMLCRQAASRNGPPVPVPGYLCSVLHVSSCVPNRTQLAAALLV